MTQRRIAWLAILVLLPSWCLSQEVAFHWQQSLKNTFDDPAILPIGGTEVRTLVPFQGKLFAATGYWSDSAANNPALPGAQILRLDQPDGAWKADLELTDRAPSGMRLYLAIAVLTRVSLATDAQGKALHAPIDMLLAGVWKRGPGLEIVSRSAADNTWARTTMPGEEQAPRGSQVRAFAQHRDAVTGVDTLFAGANNAIFTGAYDAQRKSVVWVAAPEWRSAKVLGPTGARTRVASFAECGGALYAGAFDTIYQRVDGNAPHWNKVFGLTVHATSERVTGLRGLTCIRNAAGQPALLAGVEDNPAVVYRLELAAKSADGLYPGAIEANASEIVSKALGVRANYGIVAYNDMLPYPGAEEQPDAKPCTRYLMGLELNSPQAANARSGHVPYAYYLERGCDGSYSLHEIADPSLRPKPPLVSVRTLALSPFAADAPGTLYAGGFDCSRVPSHNTGWLYRGIPTAPVAQVVPHSSRRLR